MGACARTWGMARAVAPTAPAVARPARFRKLRLFKSSVMCLVPCKVWRSGLFPDRGGYLDDGLAVRAPPSFHWLPTHLSSSAGVEARQPQRDLRENHQEDQRQDHQEDEGRDRA